MNDNDNSVSIEIEECDHNDEQYDEQFDENSQNRELYNVKILSKNCEQLFTIKAQTILREQLKTDFNHRKFTIIDNKNSSVDYFLDGKLSDNNKKTPMNSTDIQAINKNEDINEIIDVLKHNKNIELNNKSINLCFKNEDGNTYKCNEYEKYKPCNYKFVNEIELNSFTHSIPEAIKVYVADEIIGRTFDRFKNMANSYNRVAGGCLDTFKEIKKLFTNK